MGVPMIVTQACRYGARQLQPGDEFTAVGHSEARLYSAMKWAQEKPAEQVTPKEEPKPKSGGYRKKVVEPAAPAAPATSDPAPAEAPAAEPSTQAAKLKEPSRFATYRRRDLTADDA